ncbi:MAG: helix-turn-helix domain-containing protein, partial [Candidatus Hodarchaeales archaeon]
MVGLHISSEEIQDIVPILGLADQDQGKVYLSLLSLGMATLGQISLISGIDFLKTQDALQVLIGSKLVKRIPGKVGRYIAQEPFLKAFYLAYDPITLVNIRKESASTFKNQIENIKNTFTDIPQEIKIQAEELQDEFSQDFEPVKSNFNGISSEFRQIIKSVENRTQINIEELQAKAQMLIIYSEKLNEEIRLANLKRLRGIPQVFETYIPEISTEVSTISQGTTNKLEKYSTDFKSQLESLKNNFQKEIGIQSTSVEEVINIFENNRSQGKLNFDNKIKE